MFYDNVVLGFVEVGFCASWEIGHPPHEWDSNVGCFLTPQIVLGICMVGVPFQEPQTLL